VAAHCGSYPFSDETWAALTEHFSTEQVLDLIFTCGQYRMLAGALNSLGVPLDNSVKEF
jgi:alkylhydroperoxidase family enzyme